VESDTASNNSHCMLATCFKNADSLMLYASWNSELMEAVCFCQYNGDPSRSMKAGSLLTGLTSLSCCNPSLTVKRRGIVVRTTRGFLLSLVQHITFPHVVFVFLGHTRQELLKCLKICH
jgi:hypothetical protein